MIIAVDFDGTLCEQCYPNIGKANVELLAKLIYRKSKGDKIILWTCRENELLHNAITWCRNLGLEFDAVNDNLQETVKHYNHNSRKITADIYVDDKAVSPNWLNKL